MCSGGASRTIRAAAWKRPAPRLCACAMPSRCHNIIHSVTNPIPRLTGAIHVYGGDFFNVERSEWDPESLLEQPYDTKRIKQRFEDANAKIR